MSKDKTEKFAESIDQLIGIDELDDILDEDDQEGEVERNFPMVEYEDVETALTEESGLSKDYLDDYQFARKINRGLIQRGVSVLEGAMKLAKQEDHPRTYEVCASLMKNISDNTKDLMSIHKGITSGGSGGEKEPKSVTNNNTQINNYGTSQKSDEDEINGMLDDIDDTEE